MRPLPSCQPALGVALLVAGRGEQLLGPLGVVLVLHVVRVLVHAGREVGVELLVLVEEELVDELVAVVEVGEGLAHAAVVEGPLAHVEGQARHALHVLVVDLPLQADAALDLVVVELVHPPARAADRIDVQLALLELLEPEPLVHDDEPLDLVEVVEADVLGQLRSPPVRPPREPEAAAVVDVRRLQRVGAGAGQGRVLELLEVLASGHPPDDVGRQHAHRDAEVEEVPPVLLRGRDVEEIGALRHRLRELAVEDVRVGHQDALVVEQAPGGDDVVGGDGRAVGPARGRIEAEAEGHLVGGELPVRGQHGHDLERVAVEREQVLVEQARHGADEDVVGVLAHGAQGGRELLHRHAQAAALDGRGVAAHRGLGRLPAGLGMRRRPGIEAGTAELGRHAGHPGRDRGGAVAHRRFALRAAAAAGGRQQGGDQDQGEQSQLHRCGTSC